MIKSLNGQNHVVVSGGNSNTRYINNQGSLSGALRYNNGNVEVFDGSVWSTLDTNHCYVDLSSQANDAINWATKKMMEEQTLTSLAQTHPAIKNAYESFKKAEEQLKTTIILSKDEQTTA